MDPEPEAPHAAPPEAADPADAEPVTADDGGTAAEAGADEAAPGGPDDGSAPSADPALGDLDGIGPTYAERLAAAGYADLAALAAAEPEAVAEAADVPTSTAVAWIEAAADEVPEPSPWGSADLTDLDGIGPAYAERLADAGVASVLELAVADPAELADAVGVPESTVADWVAQADGLLDDW